MLILILIFVFRSLRVPKFLPNLLVDFFVNLDPNSVIFYSVDLSSSYISKNIEITNLSPQFIIRVFKEFFKNILILRGFNPYSPLYF